MAELIRRYVSMTETKGEYAINDCAQRCQCGNLLGMIKLIDGLEVLYIGNVIVRSISGNCAKCGREYYYSLNGKLLERLIKRLTE